MEQRHFLAQQISQRVTRFLKRRGILARTEDNGCLTLDGGEINLLQDIHSHSVAYRALDPRKVRRVFWQQTAPP